MSVLRKQYRFFLSVLVAADLVMIAIAGVLSYFLRFEFLAGIIPPKEELFSYQTHAIPVDVAAPLMMLAMLWAGQYRSRRDERFYREASAIVKGTVAGVGLTIVILSLFRSVLFEGRQYSGWQFVLYGLSAMALLLAWRFCFRIALRVIRAHGFNVRHVAIIGTGRLGQLLYHTLRRNSWTGITPAFFISHHDTTSRIECVDLPVRSGLRDLEATLDEAKITGVFIAMPGRMAVRHRELLQRLERYSLDVRMVPDMSHKYVPLNMEANELDGMPVLSIRESPLSGWGRIAKRTLDLVRGLS